MKHATRNTTLFIDASNPDTTKLALIGDRQAEHVFEGNRLSEILLPEIKKFLKKAKVQLKDLETIMVVAGPGHFSRIRTAVATANALAYGLQIKIIGVEAGVALTPQVWNKKTQTIVRPVYDSEPNITLKK